MYHFERSGVNYNYPQNSRIFVNFGTFLSLEHGKLDRHFVSGNYYRSVLTRHLFATAKFLLTNNADLNR